MRTNPSTLLLLLTLLLLTGCGWNKLTPSLQVMALAAKQQTPLETVESMQHMRCDYDTFWYMNGTDDEGRALTVILDDQIHGYVYTETLPWEEASARVKAAGYTLYPQEPTLAPPKHQAWLVYVTMPDASTGVVLVSIPDGAMKLMDLGALKPCDW